MTAVEDALKAYNGKRTDTLAEIRAAFSNGQGVLSDLISLVSHEEAPIADGATWLIKDCLEDGIRLTKSQTQDLAGQLCGISSWQAQLHICQAVRHFEMPPHLADSSADWLTGLLKSDRPFLRAWSMDALQHLALRNTTLTGRADAALAAAEQDSSASVRARARGWRKHAKRQSAK